jgi:hypothetical protein
MKSSTILSGLQWLFGCIVYCMFLLSPAALSSQTAQATAVSVGNTLYVTAGATQTINGSLSFAAGSNASTDAIPADNGATFDGTPHNPLIYLVRGVSGTFSGGATQFSLFVDSKTAVGNGVQLEVLYDLNGDGVFDRTEMYHYFATDAVAGFENYTQASFGGLESSTGALGNMTNGTIEIMLWNAIGTNPSFVNASATLAQGSQSVIVLPFTNLTTGGGGNADFSLAATPGSQSASAGNSTNYTISIGALNGFAGGVGLSVSGVPAGATAAFTPASVNGSGSSTLTIATASSTPAGSYTLSVAGTSAGLTHTANVLLVVSSPGGGSNSFEAEAGTLSGGARIANCAACSGGKKVGFIGNGANNTVTIGKVNVSSSGNFQVEIDYLTSGARTFFITVNGGAPLQLRLNGTSFSTRAKTTISLPLTAGANRITFGNPNAFAPDLDRIVVNGTSTGGGDFSLSLSPSTQTVTAGNSTNYTATITPVNGFAGAVSLAVSGLPAGVNGSFAPASVSGSGSSTLNISTSSSNPASSSTLTVTGKSGNLSHSATVTLAIQAANACTGPNCTSKRLKIVNGCGNPMWIFFQTGFNGGTLNAQNQKLLANMGDFIEYDIPDKGLAGVRFWPGMECDNTGNNCHIGASGGPVSNGFTCPGTIGCAPPIDSKFEGTFGCVSSMPLANCQANPSANPPAPLPRADFWDASMVDGYTLPVKVVVHGSCPPGNPGGPAGGIIDCSTLHFSDCPQHENLSTNGQFPSLADENLLRLHPTTGQVVGCYSPSSKLTMGQWQSIPNPPFTGTTFNPADPQAQMYACPTPPITPDVCRAGPAATTNFTNLIHAKCNNTYAYAYDDVNGLSSCPATTSTSYEVTFFCPQ